MDPKFRIVLDFETFWGTKYSLSQLSYTDYIWHEKFALNGLAVILPSEIDAIWIPPEDCEDFLRSFSWGQGETLVCHNTLFDGMILHKYGIHPSFYGCTLALARSKWPGQGNDLDTVAKRLGFAGKQQKDILMNTKDKHWREMTEDEQSLFATYGMGDVEATSQIWDWMNANHVYPGQLRHIDIIQRCFCDPILRLDRPRAVKALQDDLTQTQELIKASGHPKSVLSSNQQFAQLLRNAGITPPMKPNAKENGETYAFAKSDLGFQSLYEHEDLVPVLDGRIAAKSTITESRLTRMIRIWDQLQNLAVGYLYYGAHTGRLSGTNKMNYQSLKRGSEARKSIIAPPGYVLLVFDSSQIEARGNAWNSDHEDLISQFQDGKDVYSIFASHIYKRPVDRKRKAIHPDTGEEHNPDFIEGFVGKVCVLGLGYGMGASKFRITLASGAMGARVILEPHQAYDIVQTYRSINYPIAESWRRYQQHIPLMAGARVKPTSGLFARADQDHADEVTINGLTFMPGGIRLPNTMMITYPNLKNGEDGWTYTNNGKLYKRLYGGIICENGIQALANIVIGEQVLAIDDLLREYDDPMQRIVMLTHDENVMCIQENLIDEISPRVERIMSTPPTWAPTLPVACEGGWAKEYSK